METQILQYDTDYNTVHVKNHLLLFAGENYYPGGGWNDYVGAFSTIESALEAAANYACDWWHIVSIQGEPSIVGSGHTSY